MQNGEGHCNIKLGKDWEEAAQESGSLQEVGGASLSVDLELAGIIRGAESAGGGGGHRSLEGGEGTHVDFVSTFRGIHLSMHFFSFFQRDFINNLQSS